jgi:hypothetical protein
MYVNWFTSYGNAKNASPVIAAQPPKLVLNCPASVQRGSVMTCTATAQGGAMQNPVWTFTDAAGNTIPAPAGTSTTWGGTMVVGGTMRVSATVAGVQKDTTATITITARPWGQLSVQVTMIGQHNLPYPPSTLAHLANTDIVQPSTHSAKKITAGPNTGWWYLSTPLSAVPAVHRWSNAWQSSDPWYQLQTGGSHPSGNGSYCGPADMPGIEQSAREHEGMSTGPSQSHLSVMRAFFANFSATADVDSTSPQAKLERFRDFGTATADSAFATAFEADVRSPALTDPRQTHYDPQTSQPGNPGVVPFVLLTCHLRW